MPNRENYTEAERMLVKATELAPNDADVYCNLGNVLQAQDQIEAAIVNFLKAIKLSPDYVEAHFNLGNAYREQEQFEDAIKSYQKALVLKRILPKP